MKELNEYRDTNLVELSEDIDYLIDNKPQGARKGGKLYKNWIKEIEDRMKLYNDYTYPTIAYVKKYEP